MAKRTSSIKITVILLQSLFLMETSINRTAESLFCKYLIYLQISTDKTPLF
uniref:Uncharacterized protein n=1 Tax=Rhizophora mucronata TaxID=61149 RepID=A0A2P2IWS9_RHIMU